MHLLLVISFLFFLACVVKVTSYHHQYFVVQCFDFYPVVNINAGMNILSLRLILYD